MIDPGAASALGLDLRALGNRFDAEQADLDALCAERTPSWRQAWPANDLYGCAPVLRKYAGIADDRSIHAVIPHGVYLSHNAVSRSEQTARLPAALSFPAYRTSAYRSHGMVAVPSAAPFVYAERLMRSDRPRIGTIFIPVHATELVTPRTDWDGLADQLAVWPAERGPVTVMIYWRDYQLGHHMPFVERGLEVVSSGHFFDPDFLLRHAYLLSQHRWAASNARGSHVFYAVQAGCAFHIFDWRYKYSDADIATCVREDGQATDEDKRVAAEITAAFASPSEAITQAQRELVDYYLGVEHALEPEEMRGLIAWLERLDRFGSAVLMGPAARRFSAAGPGARGLIPHRWLRYGWKQAWKQAVPRARERAKHTIRSVYFAVRGSTVRSIKRLLPFLKKTRSPGNRRRS